MREAHVETGETLGRTWEVQCRGPKWTPGARNCTATSSALWPKPNCLRACLETTRGAVFGEKAGWRGATKENIPGGSSTEEQRSQTAFSAKTLRAAGLLSVAGVGSVVTARCGDASTSPPWPQPKSLAAAPLVVSKQAPREMTKIPRPCRPGPLTGRFLKQTLRLGELLASQDAAMQRLLRSGLFVANGSH